MPDVLVLAALIVVLTAAGTVLGRRRLAYELRRPTLAELLTRYRRVITAFGDALGRELLPAMKSAVAAMSDLTASFEASR